MLACVWRSSGVDCNTVPQVKQNTEMESHEEKLHKMIIASKVNDTKASPFYLSGCYMLAFLPNLLLSSTSCARPRRH